MSALQKLATPLDGHRGIQTRAASPTGRGAPVRRPTGFVADWRPTIVSRPQDRHPGARPLVATMAARMLPSQPVPLPIAVDTHRAAAGPLADQTTRPSEPSAKSGRR